MARGPRPRHAAAAEPENRRGAGTLTVAVASGARVAAGGARIGRRGQFHALTLLDDVPEGARREEPFGAVAAMQPFDTLDEVVARANALPYGLAGYRVTKSVSEVALG